MRKLLHNVPVWCKSVVFASFTFALALGPVLIFGPESWGALLGYPLGFAALMIGFRLMERADENNTSNHDPDDQKYLHAAMNEIEDLLRPLEKQFEKAGIYLNRVLCRLRTLFLVSNRVLCERGFLLLAGIEYLRLGLKSILQKQMAECCEHRNRGLVFKVGLGC